MFLMLIGLQGAAQKAISLEYGLEGGLSILETVRQRDQLKSYYSRVTPSAHLFAAMLIRTRTFVEPRASLGIRSFGYRYKINNFFTEPHTKADFRRNAVNLDLGVRLYAFRQKDVNNNPFHNTFLEINGFCSQLLSEHISYEFVDMDNPELNNNLPLNARHFGYEVGLGFNWGKQGLKLSYRKDINNLLAESNNHFVYTFVNCGISYSRRLH